VNVNSLLHGYLADTSSPYTLGSKTSVYYYALLAAGNVAVGADTAETATGTDAVSALVIYGANAAETATGTDAVSALVIYGANAAETATGTDALSALLGYSSGIAETATGTDEISGTLLVTFKPIVILM
jgi:hypothetical protein